MHEEFTDLPRIAYFSMEVALRNEIPTYAGGLGVLAGDSVRSAADLELPLVAVTLVSRKGYFRQELSADGEQIEHEDPWNPAEHANPLRAKVTVPIEGRSVWVGGWLYVHQSVAGGRVPVLLLDTDQPENSADDRSLTDRLYGGDTALRLKQEIVLGIGGVRLLQALQFDIRAYHLNEGHSALLTLELLRHFAYRQAELREGEPAYDLPAVRKLCNFTTHTPVAAGHDRFPYSLVAETLGELVDPYILRREAGEDSLNMTRLALNLSEYINGVAKRHAETSRKMFPGYHVRAVTNGVHPLTWTSPAFRAVYDEYLPGWALEPELLLRADCCVPGARIWQAHLDCKRGLIARVKQIAGVELDETQPILGFARRMTAYKRPDLLFTDLKRLAQIAERFPFQLVIAGKAHPRDTEGRELIAQLHAELRALASRVRALFLPNYNLALAATLTAGSDVWLNTPLPPLEASGTSGMKAAFNGVPSLSVLDGWWVEGCIEGVTGWAIGAANDDAGELYHKLGEVVLPLYYGDREAWIQIAQRVIAKNASYFHSHRMMRRYASDAYLR